MVDAVVVVIITIILPRLKGKHKEMRQFAQAVQKEGYTFLKNEDIAPYPEIYGNGKVLDISVRRVIHNIMQHVQKI